MTLHNLHSVDTKQILFGGHLKTFRLFVCTWGWSVLSPSSLLSFTVSQDARSCLVGSWGSFFPFVSLSRHARSLSIVVFLIFPRTVKSSIYTVTKICCFSQLANQDDSMHVSPEVCKILCTMSFCYSPSFYERFQ